ncbi:glycosyltransferase family 87 protein, partial [Candidatus Omnitrophota bacterium]
FFPFLVELERGQIDAVNLMLIILAVGCMVKRGKLDLLAGALLALATFFKLYCVFFIPFLLLRRKWKVVVSYGVSVAALLIISFIACRPLCVDYWSKHLPRISQFQEEGPSDTLLSPIIVPLYLKFTNTPRGMTIKDGVHYKHTVLKFTHNATVVKAVRDTWVGKNFYQWLAHIGLGDHQDSSLAMVILGIFTIILAFSLFKSLWSNVKFTPVQELIYWQIVLIAIVLSGVRTWAMNTVWFMPAAAIVLQGFLSERRRDHFAFLLPCSLALIVAALTDTAFIRFMPFGSALLVYKYIIAGLLIFLSLLLMLRSHLQKGAADVRA